MTSLALVSTTRCSGECCRNFVVAGFTQRKLQEMAFNAIDAAESAEDEAQQHEREYPGATNTLKWRERADFAHLYALDVATIASMIRPIVGPSRSKASAGQWFTEASHHFTCVHFNGTDCTNYEGRPLMCREYPYGKKCEHGAACTWKEAAVVTQLERQRKGTDHETLFGGERERCSNALVRIGIIGANGERRWREPLKCTERLGISPLSWSDGLDHDGHHNLLERS